MTPRHSSPLLLVLGVLIAWTSIRTAIALADETGALLAAADTPRLLAPHGLPRSIRLASARPDQWPTVETDWKTGRRDRITSAPANQPPQPSAVSEASFRPSPGLVPLVSAPGSSPTVSTAVLRPSASGPIAPVVADQPPSQRGAQANASQTLDRLQPYADQWALSAWAYVRPDMARGPRFDLARIGGSQIGIRGARRLDRAGQVTAFARVVSSGTIGDGLEGAVGVALKPSHNWPLALVIERREQLAGTGGRSALAAYATGGASNVPLGHGLTLDTYGAAGVVGVARRDLFAEGSAVVSRPLASIAGVDVAAGVGMWGAAQPGATRLDVGPRLSAHLHIGDARPLLAIDWRQRVVGDAAPSSSVALTLAADF